jgi:RHS repeat-associated protein
VQPLKGLWAHLTADDSYRASVPAGHAVCGVALSYRAFAPDGKSQPFRITLTQSALPSTANYSPLTTHWTYTFSAKEKDPETDLSYFGSRYYSSDLSVWLSVDPMASKYPSLSPYVYCADNPVRLVDPNGEDVWIIGDDGQKYQYKNDGNLYCQDGSIYQGDDVFARSAQSSLSELQNNSTTAGSILGNFVENGQNNIEIKRKKDVVGYEYNGKTTIRYENGGASTTTSGSVFWNPQGESIPTVDGMQQNGTIDLIHEFVHALDKVKNSKFNTKKYEGIEYREWTATYYENIVRGEMGLSLRNYYERRLIAPGRYEGHGENLLRNDAPWKPKRAASIF